jgi:hypothetical protein
MSTYSPDVKMYYGPIDADHRLIPAPDMSIRLEYQYSNDTIIGYSYIVTLTGSITGLDLRDLAYGGTIPSSPQYGLGAVSDHIHKVRKILTQNGNILQVVHGDTDAIILKAKGGLLRSLSFDESPNNWRDYAAFTATIEFNSIDFGSSTEDCGSLFLDPTTHTPGTAGIVDINKFKLKTFEDSWNISFDDTTPYDILKNNDLGTNMNINNHSFNIQYSISATGKHFFDYTDEATGVSNLLPAWEQAKNFVQYRLYEQVTNLLNEVLKNTYANGCTSSDNLSNINIPGSSSNGLLSNLGDSNYKIYNEIISCEASESDGTFSATYNAIVMTTKGHNSWTGDGVKHTVNKSINKSYDGDTPITNISINGTLEGMIEGGIIQSNVPLQLPSQGSFLISNSNALTKYDNAKSVLDKIYNSTDYNNGIGTGGKRDLKSSFKSAIGLTIDELDAPPSNDDPVPDPPHPVSFNLTHDYIGGTINYSIEYSSNASCGKKYNEISIQTTNPTKVIATFNRPNSDSCPIIQELGTFTAKTVSVTISGRDESETGQPTNISLATEFASANPGCFATGYLPIPLPSVGANHILTQQQYTKNPIDGTFTVNLTYICGTSGCS